MPKAKKPKKVSAEDMPFQVGKGGAAKRAAQAIESAKATRGMRLDAIMEQLRRNQTTDDHQ